MRLINIFVGKGLIKRYIIGNNLKTDDHDIYRIS